MYYQENNEERDSQSSSKNNDKDVFYALIVFFLIAFIFCSLIIGISYFLYKYANNQRKLIEAKNKYKKNKILNTLNVSEYKGSVEFNTNGNWTELKEKRKFENDTGFKTSSDSSITIQMYSDNQIKLYSSSECLINSLEIDDTNEKIKRQTVNLTNGEITAAVSIDGRGILHINVSDINIIGHSGLFKVIYDEKEDKGEVVVKKGLVEVKVDGSNSRSTKLSGFFKAAFEKGKINKPAQASIIMYDWR